MTGRVAWCREPKFPAGVNDYQEEWTLWGARGEKLGTFNISTYTYGNNYFGYYYVIANPTLYFGGRAIWDGGPMQQDRLGTNRASGARFYPHGEEITSTTNDRTKFATYRRDGFTGLDYADQRYYSSAYGRFNTPDRFVNGAGISEPGGWNRYSYTRGDPVNRRDPRGTCDEDTDDSANVCDTIEGDYDGSGTSRFDGGGNSGGRNAGAGGGGPSNPQTEAYAFAQVEAALRRICQHCRRLSSDCKQVRVYHRREYKSYNDPAR